MNNDYDDRDRDSQDAPDQDELRAGETDANEQRPEDSAETETDELTERRRTRRTAKTRGGAVRREGETVLRLPERSAQVSEPQTDEMSTLVAQGFTEDEAERLLSVSERMATSHEAQEAEATLRRLRFTRWLVEQGMLNEFSA